MLVGVGGVMLFGRGGLGVRRERVSVGGWWVGDLDGWKIGEGEERSGIADGWLGRGGGGPVEQLWVGWTAEKFDSCTYTIQRGRKEFSTTRV